MGMQSTQSTQFTPPNHVSDKSESVPNKVVTYFSSGLPQMRVVIDNTQVGTPPRYAQFSGGRYTTTDPTEIALLDKCGDVYRHDGTVYTCPVCGMFSSPSVREFNQHLNHAHPSS